MVASAVSRSIILMDGSPEFFFEESPIFLGVAKTWFTICKLSIHLFEGNPINLHSFAVTVFGRAQLAQPILDILENDVV